MHPWRQSLQWWVVEHQISRDCHRQERKGLHVPSWFLMRALHYYWCGLPQTPATRDRLHRIARGSTSAKNWRRLFRERWGMAYTAGANRRRDTRSVARQKTLIYLRWMGWHRSRNSGKNLFVNMDETSLSSIRGETRGNMHASRKRAPSRQCWLGRATPVPLQIPKTTLLATVCSDESYQAYLPQIRLPRCPTGKIAGREDRAALSAAEAPLEIWHGTRGTVTTPVLLRYMNTLRRKLDRLGNQRRIILLLDASPVHISKRCIEAAHTHGFALAFVPARLTWLLQPLDTHVFANLKRDIRRKHADMCIQSPDGAVSRAMAIRAHHRAIQQEITNRPWARKMARVGATGTTSSLRPELQTLVGNADMQPKFPTAAELALLLSVPLPRARDIRGWLRHPRELHLAARPDSTNTGARPSAAMHRPRERSIPRAVRLNVPWTRMFGRDCPSRIAHQCILMPDIRARARAPRIAMRAAVPASKKGEDVHAIVVD